jgi:nitrogen regulatory protein PII
MKEVKAVIHPFMLSHVLDALHAIEGFPGAAASEVQGAGVPRRLLIQSRRAMRGPRMVPVTHINPLARIRRPARGGLRRDGMVHVSPVDSHGRRRTQRHSVVVFGEHGRRPEQVRPRRRESTG